MSLLRHRPVVPSQYATIEFRQDHLGNDGNIGHDHSTQKGIITRLKPVEHVVKGHKRKAKYNDKTANSSKVKEYVRGNRTEPTQKLNGIGGSKDITNEKKNFKVKLKFADDYTQNFSVSDKNYLGALEQAVGFADAPDRIGTNQLSQVELEIGDIE